MPTDSWTDMLFHADWRVATSFLFCIMKFYEETIPGWNCPAYGQPKSLSPPNIYVGIALAPLAQPDNGTWPIAHRLFWWRSYETFKFGAALCNQLNAHPEASASHGRHA
jgi:hypothetical protein